MDDFLKKAQEKTDKEDRLFQVMENQKREKKKREKEKRKENAVWRDKLQIELTQPMVRELFQLNKAYLSKMWTCETESTRHRTYHSCVANRNKMQFSLNPFIRMITDPFSNDQLHWVLEEITEAWLKNPQDKRMDDDYLWKVMLPETFIKFYQDFFGLDRNEAQKRISETPLDGSGSSEDEADLLS